MAMFHRTEIISLAYIGKMLENIYGVMSLSENTQKWHSTSILIGDKLYTHDLTTGFLKQNIMCALLHMKDT